MKILHFKNGLSAPVKLTTQKDGLIIDVYSGETEEVLFSIYKGNSVFKNSFYNEKPLAHYEVLQAAEIIKNFDQYFNLLNQ